MYDPEIKINLPEQQRHTIIDHCRSALDAFTQGKLDEGKAFGLIFGKVADKGITVGRCFALAQNVRSQTPYKEYMDKVMTDYAIPSVTPLEKRGWVADPAELFARIKECRKENLQLIGTYHMHRVGWQHDAKRDTPTKLDAVLAKDSGLIMFIISMVDPVSPIIRAFYEGETEREIPFC